MTYPTKRPALTLDFQKSKKLDPRITFSRSSSATYVDLVTGLVKTAPDGVARFEKEGLLIEEARTNYIDGNSTIIGWTANGSANTAVTPSTTVCPDGSVTGIRVTGVIANDGARKYFTAIAATYIGSCYARSRNGSSQDVKIAFSGLVGITQTLPASGEWVRIQGNPGVTLAAGNRYFSIRAVSDGVLDIDVWGEQAEVGTFPTSLIPTPLTFTSRASTATYYDANGIIQTAAIDVARDAAYLPDENGVFRPAGLLIEEARTNEAPYSETFQDNGDDTGWRTSGGTVTPSAGTSPSNGAASSIDGSIYKRLNWGAAGTQNATSVYVKAGTGTSGTLSHQNSNAGGISFDLDAGTVTPIYTCDGTFIEPVGNGWFRIGFHRTSTATVTAVNLYLTTTPGETVLFWGVQVEKAGTFPTSYIPTSGSTATRAADVTSSSTATRAADVAEITGTNFSGWYNQSEGTVVARLFDCYGPGSNSIWSIDDVSSSNRWMFRVGLGLQATNFGVTSDNANPYTAIHACAIADNDIGYAKDGALLTPGSPGAFLGGKTRINFGEGPAVGRATGHISRLTYYPERVSNESLEALTA